MIKSKVLEIIWLIAGIVSVAVAAYHIYIGDLGENKNYLLLLMAALAFGMFFYRRHLRKRVEQREVEYESSHRDNE